MVFSSFKASGLAGIPAVPPLHSSEQSLHSKLLVWTLSGSSLLP